MARKLSNKARALIDEYAGEVGDHREWPNDSNVRRSRFALIRYIVHLEEIERRMKRIEILNRRGM